MTAEITISKGGITVTIGTEEVSENFSNKLVFIRPAQTSQKQDAGPVTVKVIDLLMITHELLVRGRITPTSTKTAKQVKDDLITIFKGANTTGGQTTVTYGGDSFDMYIEKLVIIEKAMDEPSSLTEDIAKYNIQITLAEGVKI